MGTDVQRMANFVHNLEHGYSQETAGLISMACIPFDDKAVPSRAFEKAVRKQSRAAAKALSTRRGGPSEEQAAQIARSVVAGYRDLAIRMGEPYYSGRYDKPLGLVE